uniref:Uncharacterized protein n=1 Tax=viral metagenome TaxID=1070528 RepID=A0A6H1Z977_9ZZZZ
MPYRTPDKPDSLSEMRLVFCKDCKWLVRGAPHVCHAPGNMKPTWLELAPSHLPMQKNAYNDCEEFMQMTLPASE